MAYKLIYTGRALKDIKKLDIVAKRRMKKTLEKLANNPMLSSTKLLNYKLGEYRHRVGNYRIIFDLVGDEIVVLRIGHRREIYR